MLERVRCFPSCWLPINAIHACCHSLLIASERELHCNPLLLLCSRSPVRHWWRGVPSLLKIDFKLHTSFISTGSPYCAFTNASDALMIVPLASTSIAQSLASGAQSAGRMTWWSLTAVSMAALFLGVEATERHILVNRHARYAFVTMRGLWKQVLTSGEGPAVIRRSNATSRVRRTVADAGRRDRVGEVALCDNKNENHHVVIPKTTTARQQ